MEFNENVMGQLKIQQQQKEEELYSQLENMEKIYENKIGDMLAGYQDERDRILTGSEINAKEKDELLGRTKMLQDQVAELDATIKKLNAMLDKKDGEIMSVQMSLNEKV